MSNHLKTDKEYIQSLKKDIKELSKRYYVRLNNREYGLANEIQEILVLYKKELAEYERESRAHHKASKHVRKITWGNTQEAKTNPGF